MYVSMYGYTFRRALRYRAESWRGGRGRAHEVCGHIFEATLPGIKNLVKRTPDQSVVHCWGQGHAGVIWDQLGDKLHRNALWPPNLVGIILDQSVMHYWSQKSCRGQLGSNSRQFA